MPLFEWRLIALTLGLVGPPGPPADLPAVAEVAIDGLDVFDEADDRSFVTLRLRRGDRLGAVKLERDGWVAVEPPPGSLAWVEQDAIRVREDGRKAEVVAPLAVIRSGHPRARFPGPPGMKLGRGAVVSLLDRPPATVGAGPSARTWRAIAPVDGDLRHVRADGLAFVVADRTGIVPAIPRPAPPPVEEKDGMPEGPRAGPNREIRASYSPPEGPLAGLPAEVAGEVERIEAAHRAIMRGPIEQWQLEPVRKRYEALLRRVTDAASGNAIRERIERVARQDEAARAAREFRAIVDRSRRRDREIELFLRRVALAEKSRDRPYEAEGLVQPSSRKVDGQKVFALIGPEGTTLAYLDIPPGLDARPLVARRVGVRGIVHYDENLRARLISVRDLEPLDARR